ncbi:hypothetical protein CF392_14345 [Tamilnaduibacter salinus]|uniref:Uncharacterized protein n=1 Tax=Tamilnaduibacter salinus TaxID=1484056 RepID=A0A2A2I0Z9_9GAMM|nr:hypothetical protein [Tamilnaduibacter salinus]PAV24780.1 hypothetical protein CF392_14345 [Tamilnaduibacter salinus]
MPELDPDDPVLTLWKTDDKEWMKQRRLEWKIIEESVFTEASKREIADNKRFFLKGEKKQLVGGWSLYLFTPFTDANEAKLAFFSSIFGRGGREQILISFLKNGMLWGGDMPWIRQSMKAFSQGVLGNEYKAPHCVDFEGKKVRPCEPEWFCMLAVRYGIKVMKGEVIYHGFLECFDYFFSAMEHCGDKPNDLSRTPVAKLINVSEHYLTVKEPDEDALKFAQKVVENKDEMLAIYETWPKSE